MGGLSCENLVDEYMTKDKGKIKARTILLVNEREEYFKYMKDMARCGLKG